MAKTKPQKRPADLVGNAVHVMRIATGQIPDDAHDSPVRLGGAKGGKARAAGMSPAERKAAAQKAAAARWKKQ